MHLINDINKINTQVIYEKWNAAGGLSKNDIAIIYVQEGQGNVNKEGKNIPLYEYDLYMITDQDKEAGVLITPVKCMTLFVMIFSGISVYKSKNEWKVDVLKPQSVLTVQNKKISHPFVRYYLEEMYKAWKDNSAQTANNSLLQKLFNQLVLEINKITDLKRGELENEMVELKSYIDHHFNEPIQVTDLVQSTGLNMTTFYKEFKEYTGYPPLQYMTNKRIDKAKQLLLTTPFQISAIANEVGYHDVYYFSRIFKRTVGISPRKFSELCKRKFFVFPPAFAVDLLALGVSKALLYPLSQTDMERFLMNRKTKTINPEEVSRQEPDCIICGQNFIIHKLEKIAPTLHISYKHMSWREQLLQLATKIGSKDLANKWLQQFDQRLDIVRKQVKRKIGNETIVAIRVLEGKIRVFGKQRRKVSDILYRELKLHAPAFIQDVSYYDIGHKAEELRELNANHILLLGNHGTEKQMLQIKNRLKGNIYEVNSSAWLSYSAWGHEKVLSEVLDVLA